MKYSHKGSGVSVEKRDGYCPQDQTMSTKQARSNGKSFGKSGSVKPSDSKGGF